MLFDVSIIAFLWLRYPWVCRWIFGWIWWFRTVMYILYIYWLSFPPKEILETHWYVIQAQADYLGKYVFHMCSGDDTNNWHILIDLGFRTENQVQLPCMSSVPVVSALGHVKSRRSGDDIGQTRQWLDFWNSSFETYSLSVFIFITIFRENFLNPNRRRPQKQERNQIHQILLHSATHQCLVFKRF